MNILLIVTTFLMVLSLLTYARLETFRDTIGIQAQFELGMQKTAPKYPSAVAKKRYQKTPAEKKKVGEDEDEVKREEDFASSRVSFYLFFNKKAREGQENQFKNLLGLTKILIHNLYGKQPFFQQLEAKRPEFLDELFDKLIEKGENAPKEEKILYIKDLATLELGDPELDAVLYQMLKGTEEENEKQGYPPLTDFLTLKNKNKIRVFLAPTEILQSIYDNPDLVKHIEATRYDLYKQVKDKKLEAKDATGDFERMFAGKQRSSVSDFLLDFTVTKSNPKDFS